MGTKVKQDLKHHKRSEENKSTPWDESGLSLSLSFCVCQIPLGASIQPRIKTISRTTLLERTSSGSALSPVDGLRSSFPNKLKSRSSAMMISSIYRNKYLKKNPSPHTICWILSLCLFLVRCFAASTFPLTSQKSRCQCSPDQYTLLLVLLLLYRDFSMLYGTRVANRLLTTIHGLERNNSWETLASNNRKRERVSQSPTTRISRGRTFVYYFGRSSSLYSERTSLYVVSTPNQKKKKEREDRIAVLEKIPAVVFRSFFPHTGGS